MANSDYQINGSGNFATVAALASAAGHLTQTLYFKSMVAGASSPAAGDGVLIGTEFMQIVTFNPSSMVVKRGCFDTIPTTHAKGATIWFYRNAVGRNNVTYASGEAIGVKTLPRTTSKPSLAIASAPPEGLIFRGRFERPYPPGNVELNAVAWHEGGEVTNDVPLAITWAHRDRITQADQMIGHDEADIGPEAGVTYTLRVYQVSDDAMVREEVGIAVNSFEYSMADAIADFAIDTELTLEIEARLTLHAVRAGIESLMAYEAFFTVAHASTQPYGLGYRLGESLGGVTP